MGCMCFAVTPQPPVLALTAKATAATGPRVLRARPSGAHSRAHGSMDSLGALLACRSRCSASKSCEPSCGRVLSGSNTKSCTRCCSEFRASGGGWPVGTLSATGATGAALSERSRAQYEFFSVPGPCGRAHVAGRRPGMRDATVGVTALDSCRLDVARVHLAARASRSPCGALRPAPPRLPF